MTVPNTEFVLQVRAKDLNSIQLGLDRAVDLTVQHALKQRQGVLVTRHAFTHYTIAVSKDVPFGETHERTEWMQFS